MRLWRKPRKNFGNFSGCKAASYKTLTFRDRLQLLGSQDDDLGSTRVSRVGDRVLAVTDFSCAIVPEGIVSV